MDQRVSLLYKADKSQRQQKDTRMAVDKDNAPEKYEAGRRERRKAQSSNLKLTS